MSWQARESIVSILLTIKQTQRPKLLLQTARIGLADYARERDLRRILRLPAAPPPGPRLVRCLLEMEAEMEALRRPDLAPPESDLLAHPAEMSGALPPPGSWRAERHVEILIALLGEVQLMAEAVPQPG